MILCPLNRFPISLVIFIEASFFITNKSTSNGFVFRLYSFSNISPVLSCANSRFMAATNPGCHCIFLSFIESPLYIKIITHTPKFLQPQTKPQILFEILSAHPFSFWLHRYGIRYISPQSNVKKIVPTANSKECSAFFPGDLQLCGEISYNIKKKRRNPKLRRLILFRPFIHLYAEPLLSNFHYLY